MVHSALTYLFKVVDSPSSQPTTPTRRTHVAERVVDSPSPQPMTSTSSKSTRPAERTEAFRVVASQLHAAEDFYLRAGARRAILFYILGMLTGAIGISGGLMLLAPTLAGLPIPASQIVIGS